MTKSALATFVLIAAAVAAIFFLFPAVFPAARAATPVHQVNVYVDGVDHYDFRQACSVLDVSHASILRCEQYFNVDAAQAGAPADMKVVPHSQKINGSTATVKLTSGGAYAGGRYTATLRFARGRWIVTSIR